MTEYLTDSPQFVALFMIATGVAVVGAFVLMMLYSWLSDRHSGESDPPQWQPVAPLRPVPAAPAAQTINIYVAGDLVLNAAAPGAEIAVTRPTRGAERPAAYVALPAPPPAPLPAMIACTPAPARRPPSPLPPAHEEREYQYDANSRVVGWTEEW